MTTTIGELDCPATASGSATARRAARATAPGSEACTTFHRRPVVSLEIADDGSSVNTATRPGAAACRYRPAAAACATAWGSIHECQGRV
jgi:hypothetical protein